MNQLKRGIKYFASNDCDVFAVKKAFGQNLTEQLAEIRGVIDGTVKMPMVSIRNDENRGHGIEAYDGGEYGGEGDDYGEAEDYGEYGEQAGEADYGEAEEYEGKSTFFAYCCEGGNQDGKARV